MIFHIDIDAFFATVEINKNSNLKNLPVIVCGKSSRSVVSSANYLARNYKIKAGMPVWQANTLCPKLINITIDENNFQTYEKFSHLFIELLRHRFSKKIEQISIDECYLQIESDNKKKTLIIAQKIKKMIFEKLSLFVSIGIGANKFLARTATQFGKPNGIFLLDNHLFKTKVWPLPINQMLYVGNKLADKLNQIGISTIGDLVNFSNKQLLKNIFGKQYSYYLNHANGVCFETINDKRYIFKSISCEKTFASDIYEEQEFLNQLYQLCQKNYLRMISRGLMCKTIHLKIKYSNFHTQVLSATFSDYTRNLHFLHQTAIRLFEKNCQIAKKPIRLIGISYAKLMYVSDNPNPPKLFEKQLSKQQCQLLKIINDINKKIGEHNVDLACNLLIQ